jgi:hypothetical protein
MRIDFPHPGDNFGPGYGTQFFTDVSAPAGSHYVGYLNLRGIVAHVGGMIIPYSTPGGAGAYGIDYSVSPARITSSIAPNFEFFNGALMTFRVWTQSPPLGTVLEEASVDVVLELALGLNVLLRIVQDHSAGGGGHDPMLDTILDAVTNPYVNAV